MDSRKIFMSSDIINHYHTTDEPYYPYPGCIDHRRKAEIIMDGIKVILTEVKDRDLPGARWLRISKK